MRTLIAQAALLAVASQATAQVAPFDMSPERPDVAEAAGLVSDPSLHGQADGARRHVLPAADLRFGGENGARRWSVYLTADQAAAATLHLAFRSSIFVAPELSRLKLRVNGALVADLALEAPETLAEWSAPVAPGVLAAGPNAFSLEVEQRHRTDCTVQSTYDLWTEIDPARTFLSFPLAEAAAIERLADIQAVGVGAGGGTRVAVVAPALSDAGVGPRLLELAQALTVATGMPNTSFAVSDRVTDAFRPAELKVLVGAPSALSGLSVATAGVAGDQASPRFIQDPDLGSVLVIPGRNPDAIGRAASLIADLAPPMTEDEVDVVRTSTWRLPDAPLITSQARRSFADLGAPTQEFSGRRSTVEFQVALPADFYAADYGEAQIRLDAAYAAAVLPGSRIDVYVNDNLASTAPIVAAGGGIMRQLPIDVTMRHLRPGPNLVRLEAVMLTAADEACLPGANGAGEPRFALFGTSQFVMPRFARIAQRPNLAALAGRGFPFGDAATPVQLALADTTASGYSAAATFLGKVAQAGGRTVPMEVHRSAAEFGAGDAIILGAAGAIGFEQFAQLGVDPTSLLEWRGGGPGAAPAEPEEPSLEAWRESIHEASWLAPIEAVGRALRKDAMQLPARLGGAPVPFAPGAGSSLLIAQGPNPARSGSWTLITAPSADLLNAGVERVTRQDQWVRIAGRAAALDAATAELTVEPASAVELVPTQPLSFGNLRLIGTNWLSGNSVVFSAALAAACVLLGLATSKLLARFGRRR